MKTFYLTLILMISLSMLAQDRKMRDDEALLNQGSILDGKSSDLLMQLYNTNPPDKEVTENEAKKITLDALRCYDKIITDYPNSYLLYEALYAKANNEYFLGNIETAKTTYLKVISSDSSKTRYRYRSLINLTSIAIEQKEFSSALDYLEKAKSFKKNYTCGNEYETNMVIEQRLSREIQDGLKR